MPTSNAGSSAAKTGDREIVATRLFDAPRELVFRVWTDPKHVAQWWGPTGFTTTTHEMDVRPGGVWRLTMRGPDGRNYKNRIVFVEVLKPERLVYKYEPDKESEFVGFEMTVTFVARGEKTEVTVRQHFPSATARDHVAEKHGAVNGLNQTLGRLADYLALKNPVSGAAEGPDDYPELVLTRVIDAPRALVFKAWTDPTHLKQWWGPKQFTNPVCEFGARPGGTIRIHMRAPDGNTHPMTGVIQEIVAPERLVFTSSALDANEQPMFEVLNSVSFEERDGKTFLTLRAKVTMTTPVASRYLPGMEMGWTQSLERLSDFVAQDAPREREFEISRVFDAPRALVFQMLTDADHLKHWWGPKSFEWASGKLDLRPGGTFHYCMRAPNGSEMWGKFVYREIVPPERIVFVNSFSDKDGKSTRNPWSPTWPVEVLNTLTLSERDGKTTLTLRGGPINATEEERATFATGTESMQKGFGGTFDQLADYLATL